MKIRWTKNSVRLRITPNELKALLNGEEAREELVFPNGQSWGAVLRGGEQSSVALKDGELCLTLSDSDRTELARPDAEGVYFSQKGETPLRYFVEKDFPCVHPRASEAIETHSETFEAPPGFEERKNV